MKKAKHEIIKIIEKSHHFHNISFDKEVHGFVRVVVHYKGFNHEEGSVFIDLNERSKLALRPEIHQVEHFYKNIPKFSIRTLAIKELIAEKVAASIGRNKPRDHFDVYQILKAGYKPDLDLIKIKCEQSGNEFNIIKMFNKAKKLKNRWDEDMIPLLIEEVDFSTVMRKLAKYFNLKEEKDKIKDN